MLSPENRTAGRLRINRRSGTGSELHTFVLTGAPASPESGLPESTGQWTTRVSVPGHTPASRGDEIRAASPVNVFGKIIGDFKALNTVRNGEKITVEKIEE